MSRFKRMRSGDGSAVMIDLSTVTALEASGSHTVVYVPGGTVVVGIGFDEVVGMIEGSGGRPQETLREIRVSYDPFDDADRGAEDSLVLSMTRDERSLSPIERGMGLP